MTQIDLHIKIRPRRTAAPVANEPFGRLKHEGGLAPLRIYGLERGRAPRRPLRPHHTRKRARLHVDGPIVVDPTGAETMLADSSPPQ